MMKNADPSVALRGGQKMSLQGRNVHRLHKNIGELFYTNMTKVSQKKMQLNEEFGYRSSFWNCCNIGSCQLWTNWQREYGRMVIERLQPCSTIGLFDPIKKV